MGVGHSTRGPVPLFAVLCSAPGRPGPRSSFRGGVHCPRPSAAVRRGASDGEAGDAAGRPPQHPNPRGRAQSCLAPTPYHRRHPGPDAPQRPGNRAGDALRCRRTPIEGDFTPKNRGTSAKTSGVRDAKAAAAMRLETKALGRDTGPAGGRWGTAVPLPCARAGPRADVRLVFVVVWRVTNSTAGRLSPPPPTKWGGGKGLYHQNSGVHCPSLSV